MLCASEILWRIEENIIIFDSRLVEIISKLNVKSSSIKTKNISKFTKLKIFENLLVKRWIWKRDKINDRLK